MVTPGTDRARPGGAGLSAGVPKDEAQPQANNAFDLNKYEKQWVSYCGYFLEKGYKLRPRYHPDWVPSWTGTDLDPSECEDAWVQLAVNTIDAIRVADQKHVSIKRLIPAQDDDEGKEEVNIMKYLSQEELRLDPRNHAVPLLDSFPIPDNPRGAFLVTPFLADWDDFPFARIGDVMNFVEQILQGMQFLHSKNIAHRDADVVNIMADVSSIVGEPFHPADPYTSLDGKRELNVKPLCEGSVKYYFIDFGLSSQFPSREERKMVVGLKGREKRLQEQRDEQSSYDPFKLDIGTIGYVINDRVLQRYSGFSGLGPLVARMTAAEPNARPNADEAYETYSLWARKQWAITRHRRLVSANAGLLKRMAVSILSFNDFAVAYFPKVLFLLFRPLRWLQRIRRPTVSIAT